eukprot:gene20568-11277_t
MPVVAGAGTGAAELHLCAAADCVGELRAALCDGAAGDTHLREWAGGGGAAERRRAFAALRALVALWEAEEEVPPPPHTAGAEGPRGDPAPARPQRPAAAGGGGGVDYGVIEAAVAAGWRATIDAMWRDDVEYDTAPGAAVHVLALLKEEHAAAAAGGAPGPPRTCAADYGHLIPTDDPPGDDAQGRAAEMGRELLGDAFPFLDSPRAEQWSIYCIEQEACREVWGLLLPVYAAACSGRDAEVNDAVSKARDLFVLDDLLRSHVEKLACVMAAAEVVRRVGAPGWTVCGQPHPGRLSGDTIVP